MERSHIQWEGRYCAKAVRDLFKGYRISLWAVLGGLTPFHYEEGLTEGEKRLLDVYRFQVDAIVYNKDEFILIEVALSNQHDKICRFLKYAYLMRYTPELEKHLGKEVRLIFISPVIDPLTEGLADELGVETIEYPFDEWDEYLAHLPPRMRRPNLSLLPDEDKMAFSRQPSYIT